MRAIDQGEPPEVVAAAVQACIANTLVKAIAHACEQHTDLTDCVVAGGVAENRFIRQRLVDKLAALRSDVQLHFAPARFSSDNALGVALIAWRHWYGTKG
jgi:N6-L-threonylcarbamoyladenine synthase